MDERIEIFAKVLNKPFDEISRMVRNEDWRHSLNSLKGDEMKLIIRHFKNLGHTNLSINKNKSNLLKQLDDIINGKTIPKYNQQGYRSNISHDIYSILDTVRKKEVFDELLAFGITKHDALRCLKNCQNNELDADLIISKIMMALDEVELKNEIH
jgi:hypothetical protein